MQIIWKLGILVILANFASGCVSRRVYEEDVANAIRTEREACAASSAAKDERLKRFNQLNLDGSLR